ncbi:MAG: EAL domain-containing protein [Gammaproteobacteria bacterium]|nr:EAL domain-containing protein [Gammaproteobacteria bacterium]
MTDTIASAIDVAQAGEISAEDLLRAIFLRSENPVFLVGFKTRQILACTPQVERVFGYRPEELKGRTTECLHESREQFEKFAEMSEPLLEDETLSFHGRFRMRRKDGSTFPSENFITLIHDDSGEPVAAVSVVHDLSRIEESAEAVPESARHLAAFATNIPGGIFQRIRTPEGKVYFSFLRGTVTRSLGIDPVAAQKDPALLFERMHEEDRENYRENLQHSLETLSPLDMVLRFYDAENRIHFVRSISQPRKLDDGSVAWDGIVFDITAERMAEENLRYATFHDSLTGLPNLAAFRDRLQAALNRIEQDGNRAIVAIINLQRFRIINETLGLETGDRVIEAVAERLQQVLHEKDFLARFHNDEFLALVDGVSPDADLTGALNGMLSAFDEPFDIPFMDPMVLSANIGLAVAPDDGMSPDDLLRNADTALHHVRRDASSNVEFYQETMTSDLVEHIELERALKSAILADEPEPFLQPQYDVVSGKLIGMEALARWWHEGDWISPGRFIPVAEDSGLIVDLGRQLLSRLITELQGWHRDGLPMVPVSVNFSALQFEDPDFANWLLRTLDNSGLGRKAITVEITESVFLHDFELANRIIHELHNEGVDFSLDDFGTGFSSLSYLSQLPFSVLKIDRAFVQRMLEDQRSDNLVHSIVEMGKALDLAVIAEGVETEPQMARLREMGCEAVQGFLTGKPMSLEDARELLARH